MAIDPPMVETLTFQRLITTISTRFVNIDPADVDYQIDLALADIGRFALVDRSYVFQFEDDNRSVTNTHEWCAEGVTAAIESLRHVPIETFPWVMFKYLAGETVCIHGLNELPAEAVAERREFEREGIQSMASVPMVCAGKVLGFIGFDSVRRPKNWDDETIDLIRIVGEIFANAITRRRADQALLASEQRYRQLVELAQEGIWAIDADGCTTFVNPSMAKMLGYTPAEMLGRHLFDFMNAAEREIAKRNLARRAQGVAEQHDFAFCHKDGSVVHTTIETAPMQDEQGNYVGALAGVVDVTDRHKAEAALRQSEKRFRRVFEASPVMISITRLADMRFVDVNEAFCEVTGWSQDEAIGSTDNDLGLWPDPDQKEQMLHALQASGSLRDVQWSFRTKQGQVRQAVGSADIIRLGDEQCIVVVGQDMTVRNDAANALRESESRFRRLVESNLFGVLFWTREGGVFSANDAFLQMIGYTHDDLPGGRIRWTDLTPPEHRARDEEAMAEIAARGACTPFEKEYLHKDGHRVPVLVGVAAFENGPEQGVAWVLDLSERKRAERALAESEEKYRTVITHAPVVVWAVDRDGIFTLSDGSALEGLALEPGQVVGQSVFEFYRDSPAILEHIHQALAGESTVARIEAGGRVFESYYSPMKGPDGTVQGVTGLAIDVTERQQMEDALRQREAFLVLSQRIGQVGSFDWDLASDRVVWSTEMYRIFGISPGEFDHSFGGATRLIHPDDLPRIEARVKSMLEQCDAADYEFRIVRADGQPCHAWGRGEVVCDAEGKPVRVIGTVQDITDRRRAEESVRKSEAQMRTVFEASTATINILRLSDEVILYVNPAWEEATGWRREEAVGHPARALKLWPDVEAREVLLARVRAGESLRNVEWQRRTRSGEIRDVLGSIQRIELDGRACALIFTQDISDRKRGEAQMRKLSSAVEQTADSIIITDPQGIIEYVNPAFEAITGYRAAEAIGRTPALVRSGRHDRHFYKHLWGTIRAGRVYRNVLINRKKDGTLYYEEKTITPLKDAQGRVTHFISSGIDITERMQAQERLQYLAYHDVLTELPNRALLMDRLENAVARAKRTGRRLAVLFLDLDRFKVINDTLGHDYGDGLLQTLGKRLRHCVREGDTISRVSGDEFAILLEDAVSNDDIVHVARKVLEAFVPPFDVFNRELFVTTSVGISVFPGDGEDGTTLLKHADTAMYRAKESGRNNYQFYSADMSAKAIQLLTLETGLRRALEREEFVLHYQPLIDLNGGQIIGVEALLRWQHRELGLLYPGDFIQLLEDTGLIVPVGEWVLQAACRQASQWQKDRARPLRVSVNLSARQFGALDLLDKVQGALRAAALDPESLELEITESMLMEHREATQEMLTALGAIGVRFAVDDFGTGYSSLSYLKRFAIHTLKIDRSFVRDIPSDANDASIVTTIVAMAHNLKLGVVAEGVEREEQLAFLKACRCDAYQGFYCSRPLEPRQLESLLTRAVISS